MSMTGSTAVNYFRPTSSSGAILRIGEPFSPWAQPPVWPWKSRREATIRSYGAKRSTCLEISIAHRFAPRLLPRSALSGGAASPAYFAAPLRGRRF